MPEWMTGQTVHSPTAAPSIPLGTLASLTNSSHKFDLDTSLKIKNLSRGQRAKLGLLVAMAYKPDLLLFDEPSSGLDPVVRRDMLGVIVRTIAEEGRNRGLVVSPLG